MPILTNKCCCTFDLRQGSCFVCLFFLIYCSLYTYSVAAKEGENYWHPPHTLDIHASALVCGATEDSLMLIGIILSLISLYGLRENKLICLIPMIAWLFVVICFTLIFTFSCAFRMFSYLHDTSYVVAYAIIRLIVCVHFWAVLYSYNGEDIIHDMTDN